MKNESNDRQQTSQRGFIVGIGILSLVLAAATSAGEVRSDEPPQYNRDIRPILAENCFACHGPDSAARKADLRLDQREAALKAEAFVPGSPDESGLVERIFSDEPSKIMPPPKSHKKLTLAQKDILKRWIAGGAEYQLHWSLIAPKRPQPPVVKNAGWVRNPIDNFIRAGMEARGLAPAPEADRRTLARRASLDLTGLPPEPKDVEVFVQDQAPDAYERYVDRLLQSPRWGEHRARYWLDAARYADTHGIHIDNFREMWTYRDWVINSFNANMPFDRFTIEQLAGDLLPNRTLDQQVASGFNRCNITTNEGGAISEEYLVHYTRDRVETTSQVWLGLTAGCAVCHDHKFDPLAQREFYEMAAFFNNTTQAGMDGNIKDTPPVIVVPRPEDRTRWESLSSEMAELRKQAEARKKEVRPEFEKWLAQAKIEDASAHIPKEGLKLHALLSEGKGKTIQATVGGATRSITLTGDTIWEAGLVDDKALKVKPGGMLQIPDAGNFDHGQAVSYGAWVKFPSVEHTGAIFSRMDEKNGFRGWDLWIEGNKLGTHISHHWPDNALKVVTKTQVKSREWNHLFVTYDGSNKAAGIKAYFNGQLQSITIHNDNLKKSTLADVPFKVAQRDNGGARIDNLGIQDIRFYDRALSDLEVLHLASSTRASGLLNKPAAKRSPVDKDQLFDWWLESIDPSSQDLAKKLNEVRQEESVIKSRSTIAHVMEEKPEPAMAFVLHRGEYDKRRDQVKPSTPRVLPPMPSELPRNRFGFAQWLLMPEHPLTSRVTVNRYWQEAFGTGLVRTSGDFGVAGELPSHPELLDWLAVEFRESGWDVKKFFRLLVTSATYRQQVVATRDKLDKDPSNRLLARGPRFRMDAEMIRDYALASSGLLARKNGGPSVKPYQPEGVWEAVAMNESNTRFYKRESGESLYRRSLYTFWKRSAPPAAMDILNAPCRETCTVRRERTNTPLQALVTLNDVQFVEAARHLAQSTLKETPDSVDDRIDFMSKRLLCRSFRPEEAKVFQGILMELLKFYETHPEDAKKLIAVGESKPDSALNASVLAAWTMAANEMMNLDEVLNK